MSEEEKKEDPRFQTKYWFEKFEEKKEKWPEYFELKQKLKKEELEQFFKQLIETELKLLHDIKENEILSIKNSNIKKVSNKFVKTNLSIKINALNGNFEKVKTYMDQIDASKDIFVQSKTNKLFNKFVEMKNKLNL